MYRPTPFRENRPDVLSAAIQELRQAALVTLSGGELVASHIPMILRTEAGVQRLEGHVARGNDKFGSQ